MRILVIEDDAVLGDGIQVGLQQAGYSVDWVSTVRDAAHALRAEHYAVLVLDLGLPDGDGLQILRDLRQSQQDIPVLILTARDSLADRISGLDTGADDYLVKPFALDELSARLRALTRRYHGHAEPVLQHGELRLNPATHHVTLAGQSVSLSAKEFALLHNLLMQKGKVLSKAQLEEMLYSWDQEVESNAVEVHIHHLRKKLGKHVIRTIRGVGYLIEAKPA